MGGSMRRYLVYVQAVADRPGKMPGIKLAGRDPIGIVGVSAADLRAGLTMLDAGRAIARVTFGLKSNERAVLVSATATCNRIDKLMRAGKAASVAEAYRQITARRAALRERRRQAADLDKPGTLRSPGGVGML